MKKHTFKQGDRVKSVWYVNSKARKVEYGTVVEVQDHGVDVDFDRKDVNRPDGSWYVSNNKVQHDTNLQVGDWVRYKAVEPYTEGYDTEDGKVGQITHLGQEFATIKGELNQERFISNLVKIQPPQEAQMETVKIKHRVTGTIISDVTESPNPCQGWVHLSKDGSSKVIYYRGYWEPLTEWVTIQVEKEGWSTMNTYCLVYGPRGTKGDKCTEWRYPQ